MLVDARFVAQDEGDLVKNVCCIHPFFSFAIGRAECQEWADSRLTSGPHLEYFRGHGIPVEVIILLKQDVAHLLMQLRFVAHHRVCEGLVMNWQPRGPVRCRSWSVRVQEHTELSECKDSLISRLDCRKTLSVILSSLPSFPCLYFLLGD